VPIRAVPPYQGEMDADPKGVELGTEDSNLDCTGPRPGRLPLSESPSEPPSGADPDLTLYRSAATAVCGGEVSLVRFDAHRPALMLVPPAIGLRGHASLRADLNGLPPDYETGALPGELQRRGWRPRIRTWTSVAVSRSRAGRVADYTSLHCVGEEGLEPSRHEGTGV
jgi:hypothetical protein